MNTTDHLVNKIINEALADIYSRITLADTSSMPIDDALFLRMIGININDWHDRLHKKLDPILDCSSIQEQDKLYTAALSFLESENKLIRLNMDKENKICVTITPKGVAFFENKKKQGNMIFIVHGHNEANKYELKSFLSELGLNSIILHEQDDRGLTIVEKFEFYAKTCRFAFVLLTPDDVIPQGLDSTEKKWRARQNVIMELGWFMGVLGRENVVILYKEGDIEIPSDISGVLYLPFTVSILEVSEKIRKRLTGAGLI
ncbi:MAG: nucleotide-binding protein [Nitrospirae bacterium YQR-1]